LRITDVGAANLVVWNPWVAKAAAMPDFGDEEWTGMICIEAANALDNAITLGPGESHLLRQRISLARRDQD
jgi:glucose-6-phosphate 1-epimerase